MQVMSLAPTPVIDLRILTQVSGGEQSKPNLQGCYQCICSSLKFFPGNTFKIGKRYSKEKMLDETNILTKLLAAPPKGG